MRRPRTQQAKQPVNLLWRNAGYIIFVILVFFIVGWIYLKFSSATSFPVRTVQIKGSYSHVKKSVLRDTITPFVKVSFFSLRTVALQASLEQIPWIATANIRQVFPATLIVTIIEQQPVAVWNNETLLTAQGDLFSPLKNSYPVNLPRLIGPVDQEKELLNAMQRMNKILQPLNLTVQQLTLSARRSWVGVLSNGVEVTLGQRNIWQRLQRMVVVFPKIIGPKLGRVISMDLRYPNGIAVQWKRGRK